MAYISSTLRNHRRKLRLQAIDRLLDLLCDLHDHLDPGHPDRPRLLREIARWNVEYQAED
jgi:hypothetical protein